MKQAGVVDTESDIAEWQAAAEERDAMKWLEAYKQVEAAGLQWMVAGPDEHGRYIAGLRRNGERVSDTPQPDVRAGSPTEALLAALERHSQKEAPLDIDEISDRTGAARHSDSSGAGHANS